MASRPAPLSADPDIPYPSLDRLSGLGDEVLDVLRAADRDYHEGRVLLEEGRALAAEILDVIQEREADKGKRQEEGMK